MDELKEIQYSTPEQQIELLKSKKLLFEDEILAKQRLHEYGYYNIINSYKSPYIELIDKQKRYKDDVTFEQIYSLFILDHNLRNSIMAAMLDLEERLRAAASEVISKSFGTNQDDYLRWENYRDRHTQHTRFSLKGILGTLRQNIESGKDPIKYYREKYGIIPPWILFKGTYFSTLINFVRLFKEPQKKELISIMYNCSDENSSLKCMKTLFSDTLFICLDYRNRAAHGGRIYNFTSSHAGNIANNDELFSSFPNLAELQNAYGISQLFTLLNSFADQEPLRIIESSLRKELNRHLSLYPDDMDYLQSITGLTIYKEHIVWISTKSKKYHSNPNCSGLQNATRIPHENAITDGYVPCKRCCPISETSTVL